MSSRFSYWSLVMSLAVFGLCGCGGVREEAKVATAVQTMMVLAVEAAITYSSDSELEDQDPIPCTESGTYQPDASLASIISFVTGGGTSFSGFTGKFDFDDCVISLCGETLTINGEADFELSGDATGSPRTMTIQFTAPGTSLFQSEGIIEGNPEFKYDMTVDVSGTSLGNINIQEAATPSPLQYKGKVYRAAKINELAKGC